MTEEVAHRLADLGIASGGGAGGGAALLEQAGDLFREVEQLAEATDCYVQAQAWPKAREVAKAVPKLREAVEASYKQALMRSGDPAAMAAAGAIDAAIAAYLVQGQLASIPQDIPPRASPRSST